MLVFSYIFIPSSFSKGDQCSLKNDHDNRALFMFIMHSISHRHVQTQTCESCFVLL